MKNPPVASKLVQYLLSEGLLSAEILLAASAAAPNQKIPLIHYLVQKKLIASKKLLELTAHFFHLPIHDLTHYDTDQLPAQYLSSMLIQQYYMLPLALEKNVLLLAVADPSDQQAIEDFTFAFSQTCRITLVDAHQLYNTIQQLLQHQKKIKLHTSLEHIAALEPIHHLPQNAYQLDDAPVVAYIHQLLQSAVDQKVSDIHCEPYSDFYRIRLRHDGILMDYESPPTHIAPRLVSRIKVMAELNIAERRLPQDGHFTFMTHQQQCLDVRVSICPVIHGEKMVLRLLNGSQTTLKIEQLGLELCQQQQLWSVLQQPSGLILVTGPTGSGKTITLYTLLQILNDGKRNICSAEDPVEIHLRGINQLGIQPQIGLDFSQALRCFLRQDPDVIMVGEIRDADTAEMACKAAQTGHLVLATLHTQDAVSTLLRLQQLGIKTPLLAHCLKAVIAQRLVRRLCTVCHQGFQVAEPILQVETCPSCMRGYRGRIGIFELLLINAEVKQLLLQKNAYRKITNYMINQTWINLAMAGQLKIDQKITTVDELKRVL